MVYVDGFNLYFGLRAGGWRRYYWLNIRALAEKLLRRGQTLAGVQYFSARINRPQEKVVRQATFLDALATVPDVHIKFGKYRSDDRDCVHCSGKLLIDNEKMTDVNIATAMLLDAMDDRFDTAILVSGDGDLLAPIEAIRDRFPGKRVWVCFPPMRANEGLLRAASGRVRIKEWMLKECQLPDDIVLPNGYVLRRPVKWRDEGDSP